MKIHVVQKGETLWKISEKYGVDFEELKAMNTQLSNPDMIMPGMKIKVPTTTKQVKKEQPKEQETQPIDKELKKFPEKKKDLLDKKKDLLDKDMTKYPVKKESKKPSQHPYKDASKKAIPVMKEDDYKKPTPASESLPMQPVNIPQVPEYNQPLPATNQQPSPYVQQQMPTNYPAQPQMPIMPAYHKPANHHCTPMNPVPYPVQQMPTNVPPYAAPHIPYGPPEHEEINYNNAEWMESSSVEMPQMPANLPGAPKPAQAHQHPTGYGQAYTPYPQNQSEAYEQTGYPSYPGYTPNHPAGQQPYAPTDYQSYPGYGQGYPAPQPMQQSPYMPQWQQGYGPGMLPQQPQNHPAIYGPGMVPPQAGYPVPPMGYPQFQPNAPEPGMGYPSYREDDEDNE